MEKKKWKVPGVEKKGGKCVTWGNFFFLSPAFKMPKRAGAWAGESEEEQ